MFIVEFLFWVLSSLLGLVILFFLVEVVAACIKYKTPSISSGDVNPIYSLSANAVFLIPAHNEEDVIAATLESVCPQLRDGDEVVVIADNCTDSTKAIAEAYDVSVLERFDDNNKGKGFALDYAIHHIKDKNYDVIIMIDADCILDKNSRDELVEETLSKNRPVQCLYLMYSKTDKPSLSEKISEFAWVIKNKIRPIGLLAMGGPCQLMGTGMAFPAKTLYEIDMANGCIVEDMKLGLDLTIMGKAPIFFPSVKVWSYFPETDESNEGQKSRWIHGHLEMIVLYVPKLLKAFLLKRELNILFLCLELLILPLILLLMVSVVLFIVSLFLSIFLGVKLLAFSSLLMLLLSLALALSWLIEGKTIISLSELFAGFSLRLKSSSVYLKFFTDKRKTWNKTSRK